jgi:DNA polymerase-1
MKEKKIQGKMILQVHDELIFEVPKNNIKKIIKMVVHEMENSIKFKVPIKVDYNYGHNWYEAH